MRRAALIFFLIALGALFFWRDILSLSLQGVVYRQLQCQIAFRDLRWQNGQIHLNDAIIFDCADERSSFHVRVPKITIAFQWLCKSVLVHITMDQPHLTLLDGAMRYPVHLVKEETKWLQSIISVENGTFEWPGAAGRFSVKDRQIRIEAGGGSATAQLRFNESVKTMDCTFDQIDLALLSLRIIPCECRGRLSGAIMFNLAGHALQTASGRLKLEGGFFNVAQWQKSAGAELIEWEGKVHFANRLKNSWLDEILSCPDRMKIQVHQGYVLFKNSLLEHLDGTFSNHHGVGLRWEITGPSFSWEGKGFSKSRSVNWLQSHWSVHEEKGDLRVDQIDLHRSEWAVELDKAGPEMVRLIQDVWPVQWPCQMKSGSVSARWVGEETDRVFHDWKLERLSASQIALLGPDWSLQCKQAEASIDPGEGDFYQNAAISLVDGSGFWKNMTLSSLTADCRIVDRMILQSSFSGVLNECSVQGSMHGGINQLSLQAQGRFSDDETIEAAAEWVRMDGRWDISSAQAEARKFNINRLNSLIPMDWAGTADLDLCYEGGELKIDGAVRSVQLKTKENEWAIGPIGSSPAPHAGFFVVWDLSNHRWRAETDRVQCDASIQGRTISFEGQLEAEGRFQGDFLSCPDLWEWNIEALVSNAHWGALQNGQALIVADSEDGLVECSHVKAEWAVGADRLAIHGVELRKCDGEWLFDFRIEHGFWDWGRIAGSAALQGNDLVFAIDSSKSHLLNAPFFISQCQASLDGSIRFLKLSWRIGWDQILAAAPLIGEIDPGIAALLRAPIQGAGIFEIDFAANRLSTMQLKGDGILWKGAPTELLVRIKRDNGEYALERCLLGAIDMSCLLRRDAGHWNIEEGRFRFDECLDVHWGGIIRSLSHYELAIQSVQMDVHKTAAPFLWPSLMGRVEGKGYLNIQWQGQWICESDLDLLLFDLKSQSQRIDNAGPIQLHFSKEQGLLIRGLDLQIHPEGIERASIHSRIGWMQFDCIHKHFVFHHVQMNLPADSVALLCRQFNESHPVGLILQALDKQHDLELALDMDCASDFSSLNCTMREGFIPLFGAVRHLQNVNVSWNSSKIFATMSALQGGHSLKIGALMECKPCFGGRIYLEDEQHPLSEGEMPLTIEWEVQPDQGLIVHSCEGTFGGIEASFHAQGPGCLIGSARMHFGPISEILPPRLGKVFRQLKMGKGYELKGHLFYDGQDLSRLSFKGLMSGKQCELFGFQIQTLLTQVEADASHVHFFELKGSDAAGMITVDEFLISRDAESQWSISLPHLQLKEFRPSLLQKTGREAGHVGPLVVRDLTLSDLRGALDDSATLKAKGDAHFINSFKREHTVFDLPSDFLSRIIGLDHELLVPVRGHFKFELKKGRFWLSDLQDAYSEGKRSKFFLVNEGLSPTIDLDGNVHIFVTMKQYVLFKITENFLLTIDGPIESPFFHLQKKSKLLGL